MAPAPLDPAALSLPLGSSRDTKVASHLSLVDWIWKSCTMIPADSAPSGSDTGSSNLCVVIVCVLGGV